LEKIYFPSTLLSLNVLKYNMIYLRFWVHYRFFFLLENMLTISIYIFYFYVKKKIHPQHSTIQGSNGNYQCLQDQNLLEVSCNDGLESGLSRRLMLIYNPSILFIFLIEKPMTAFDWMLYIDATEYCKHLQDRHYPWISVKNYYSYQDQNESPVRMPATSSWRD
jgi:hypothetical protein